MAWERRFLRARVRIKCSLSHRESKTKSQTALLAPELCCDRRRTGDDRQAVVFFLVRVCPRKCQHRLQSRQYSAVRCPRATGIRWSDSRRQLNRRAAECSNSLPRLHRLAAARLGSILQLAMVSANFRRQLPHPQRAGTASHPAFDRTDHAQQLLEHGHQQHLHVHAAMARHVCIRRQRTPSYPGSQLDAGVRISISLQCHVVDGFRLRNVRRQSVHHAHHDVPFAAQSGKIPGPLRPKPSTSRSCSWIRGQLRS